MWPPKSFIYLWDWFQGDILRVDITNTQKPLFYWHWRSKKTASAHSLFIPKEKNRCISQFSHLQACRPSSPSHPTTPVPSLIWSHRYNPGSVLFTQHNLTSLRLKRLPWRHFVYHPAITLCKTIWHQPTKTVQWEWNLKFRSSKRRCCGAIANGVQTGTPLGFSIRFPLYQTNNLLQDELALNRPWNRIRDLSAFRAVVVPEDDAESRY